MEIVQVNFYVPEDISTGLATGIYRNIGGVVRYAVGPNKGRIVKHLDPVDMQNEKIMENIGVQAINAMKNYKKEIIIVAGAIALIGTGIYAYKKIKNSEPKVVVNFRNALREYVQAIRERDMDVDKINNLLEALDDLNSNKNREKNEIELNTDDLEILIGRIYEYTVTLANNNKIELEEIEDGDTIIDLEKYLKAQKSIFDKAIGY